MCKEFSRIVCVSLFSYQGCLSCDSLFTLSHLSTVCQVLFSTFFELFEVLQKHLRSDFVGSVQATYSVYHVVSHLSTIIFIFLKKFRIVLFKQTILYPATLIRYHFSHISSSTFLFIFHFNFLREHNLCI